MVHVAVARAARSDSKGGGCTAREPPRRESTSGKPTRSEEAGDGEARRKGRCEPAQDRLEEGAAVDDVGRHQRPLLEVRNAFVVKAQWHEKGALSLDVAPQAEAVDSAPPRLRAMDRRPIVYN
jgi:hypothetical protein